MFETGPQIAILLIFVLAGFVKGVVGLGLPTIGLGLMAIFLPLPTAMALVLVPSTVTNFWQACSGGHGVELLKRFWPFFLSAAICIWIGGLILNTDLLIWLPALLGLLLIAHGLLGLSGSELKIQRKNERPAGFLLGAINGILTGMTGSFTVPGVLYLQSTDLDRNELVQAMGILFLVSTLGLAAALYGNGFLTQSIGISSVFALLPALGGMALGQRVRNSLSENLFKQIFLISLIVLGLYLIGLVIL